MSALYEPCGGCGAETPSERCFGCFHDFGPSLNAPSNANTSGLIAEIDAEMNGRQRGYADVRGELLFRCRDRIADLEADLSQANANGASHWSRATAAEARADRLANIVKLLDECIWFNPDTQNFEVNHDGSVEKARAALQQENQP